jgi:hypothetical protein
VKKNIFCSLLAGLLLAPTAWAAAWAFIHPKLKSNEFLVKSVIVLPAMVEMSKQGVKGAEGMGAEADQASTDIGASVSAALNERGMEVANPFSEDALKENSDLKYALADVQRKFDEVAKQLYKKPKDVRKGRFTLGDSVAVLNTTGKADALVFIRSKGVKQTKGKGFMTGGVIGLATSGNATFVSWVALVDAKTGDILFLSDFLSSGLPKAKLYEKTLQKIPVSTGGQ